VLSRDDWNENVVGWAWMYATDKKTEYDLLGWWDTRMFCVRRYNGGNAPDEIRLPRNWEFV
jgi:hypothetical protein